MVMMIMNQHATHLLLLLLTCHVYIVTAKRKQGNTVDAISLNTILQLHYMQDGAVMYLPGQ